jgi:hypothetical protein
MLVYEFVCMVHMMTLATVTGVDGTPPYGGNTRDGDFCSSLLSCCRGLVGFLFRRERDWNGAWWANRNYGTSRWHCSRVRVEDERQLTACQFAIRPFSSFLSLVACVN